MNLNRAEWEWRWENRSFDCDWNSTEPPVELRRLVEAGQAPSGAALDLGCGAGAAAAYLAGSFRPAVGVDVAFNAILAAREGAGRWRTNPAFVVAEAPALPFGSQAFGLVFDRGCLPSIPRRVWHSYFREVERVLRPGGIHQLLFPDAHLGRLASIEGLRTRLRRLRRRKGPPSLSRALMAGLLPASVEILVLERVPFRSARGQEISFSHLVLRKGD